MKKFLKILDVTEDVIASSLLIITSFLVFFQAILRYQFNYSISWSEEVARMMIAWFIFIGSSIAVRENAHVNMDALSSILRGKIKIFISIIVEIINIVFCIMIIFAGINMIKNAINLGSMATSIKIPLYIPYASVPVGVSLMLIRYVMRFLDTVKELFKFDDLQGEV
ncbi:MAG: TRAP transporter small permease [Tissierella sp.]|nr:TRAP transporter small permease [Tissierella sp.]